MQGAADYRGAGYMCIAMLCAAVLDVTVKALSVDFSTAQIVMLRAGLALPIMLVICAQQRVLRELLHPLWGWQLYRGLLAAGANFGFFYALVHLDLVTAIMLAFLSPVLIVLLARGVLQEQIGWTQWVGVALGFVGALWVLQPACFAVHPAALAVLASALCWALLSLSNRQLKERVPPAVLSFYTAPISALLGAIWASGQWVAPDGFAWSGFLLLGLVGGGLHWLTALAYRYAEASRIAPLEYTNLIWAALAVWLIWGEVAPLTTWVGGAVLLAGGYLALQPTGALSSPRPQRHQKR